MLPGQAAAQADRPSQLFQYGPSDTRGFEPDVFTGRFHGANDQVRLTATGFDCGSSTIGAMRVVVEPQSHQQAIGRVPFGTA